MVREYFSNKRNQVEVGKTYGRFVVLSFAGRNKHGNLLWNCKCSCGTMKQVLGCSLLTGKTSCGCASREATIKRNTKHGLAKTPEYATWSAVKGRCTCKTHQDYAYYGGRGIKICDRWLVFENFLADMGPRPSSRHTIERRDNNSDYCADNCSWQTRKVQSRNKRDVPLYEYKGEKKSVAEWAEIYGLHPETLRNRIKRSRWSMERCLTAKPRPIKGVHY